MTKITKVDEVEHQRLKRQVVQAETERNGYMKIVNYLIKHTYDSAVLKAVTDKLKQMRSGEK